MILEVQLTFSENDGDWEVNVWNVETNDREDELEAVFPTEQDASEYIDSLVKNKYYVVTHI